MNKPLEYLCQIDGSVIPAVDTQWTVVDSNLVIWNPEINPTTELVSLIDGGIALNTPYIMNQNGARVTLSVSTAGILSFTTTSTLLVASDAVAALTESATVTWLFIVGLDGQLRVTTETPLENKYYYPAIVISFEPSAATDQFELHAIKPNTSMHRK